jgi:GTP-binding protein
MFVVDIAGSEGREPISDLENLRRELSLYDPTLADRPWVVIANKMDVAGADEKLAGFRERFPKVEIVPVVARDGVGMDEVRGLLDRLAGEEAAP